MNPDTLIQYAAQIGGFINSEGGKAVFAELDRLYTQQWKSAQAPAERELVWAKARALDDLRTAFQAVVDAGALAEHQAERAKRQA